MRSQQASKQLEWSSVNSVEEACLRVDLGVVLDWENARSIVRQFSHEELSEIVGHIAVRFCEYYEEILFCELMVDSLLQILTRAENEDLYLAFLESFLAHPDAEYAGMAFVEVALRAELTDVEHQDELFATSVILVCEFAMALYYIKHHYADRFPRADRLLNHTATFLLSVSNSTNLTVRLSLLNCFSLIERKVSHRSGINKLCARFGHTLLDYLFQLLFIRKTEAVALQYLLTSTPAMLEADWHTQKIIHETWKLYMIRQPERFVIFLRELADYLVNNVDDIHPRAYKAFFQHLAALIQLASDIDHKQLGQALVRCFMTFPPLSSRNEVLRVLVKEATLRQHFKKALELVLKEKQCHDPDVINLTSYFGETKRGRRPSFMKKDKIESLKQVRYLSKQVNLVRAS